MSEKKDVIKLTQPWIDNAMDALSLDAKKSLLELIYNRKSGIITRQELIDVLFNEKDKKTGLIIETVV